MKDFGINNTSFYNSLKVFGFPHESFVFMLGNDLRVHKINRCHDIFLFLHRKF